MTAYATAEEMVAYHRNQRTLMMDGTNEVVVGKYSNSRAKERGIMWVEVSPLEKNHSPLPSTIDSNGGRHASPQNSCLLFPLQPECAIENGGCYSEEEGKRWEEKERGEQDDVGCCLFLAIVIVITSQQW
jgi:hypothetical protein